MLVRSRENVPLPVVLGFGVLALMVGASFALSIYLTEQTARTAAVSDYRRAVTDVMSAARDVETGQRGYLLTHKEKYLESFNAAAAQLGPAVDRVARELPGRGPPVAAEMRASIGLKMSELRQTIMLEQRGDHAGALALVASDAGKQAMDRLRNVGERERQWAITRTNQLLDQSRMALTLLVVGLIVGALAVVALSLVWLAQARRQFAAADTARRDAVDALSALQTETAAREDAEGRLRQMQKIESLGQLTGGIAHDFNNMLAVVMGGIELAKRKLRTDPDRADALLDNAREGATRAATLTARLLAFSRNQPLAPAPLDMNKLLGGMCDMLARTLGDALEVECVYAAGLWRCYADPSEVENAVLNLAINSRDAMSMKGGKLTVETANAHIDDNYARERPEVAAGQYVLICVSDTGIGMAQDVADRAFDPFFTTKEVGKGTGLGLSQVFGFAKQSGGHVAIYSEVGQGTTVKLYLPRYAGTQEIAGAEETTHLLPAGVASEIILVVEDEQRLRHFAVDALREMGYTAISAASPREALKALNEQPEITMVFTDIVMPEMTGRQLADQARELRPDLKILFTTGYTRNAVVHNGMIDVGVAFLSKPYSMGDLARKIRAVLDGGGINRPV